MSWRISTVHHSTYRYREPVVTSYNEVRLTPHSSGGQLVLNSSVTVSPTTSLYRYTDYFSTHVVAFDIPDPHDELVVVGSSVVDTATPRPRPTGLSWSELDSEEIRDSYVEYLRPTSYAMGDEELFEIARQFRNEMSPIDAVELVKEWIRSSMTYELGATRVSTSALEAWRSRRGVCQDFAHLGILLLRSIGVPSRYVSGYLHPTVEGEIGVTLAGAGHAWMECWVGAWYPIDPTHPDRVGDRYVTVARGRDYADVAPFRGIYQGGVLEGLNVTVDLTRLA
jgi:transglutaminase-like putative cysteine protease